MTTEAARIRCAKYRAKQKAAGVFDTPEFKAKQRARQKGRYKTKAQRDSDFFNSILLIKW